MREITQHYIDGRFVDSHGRATTENLDPATELPVSRVTLGDEHDTRDAVAAAKAAFAHYSRSGVEERSRTLLRLHAALDGRVDELAAAQVHEFGATRQMSRGLAQRAADSFLWAEQALREVRLVTTIGHATVTLEPSGVAGLITPWNASSTFICGKLAFALAAGCTAVIKPSEMSPLQTQVLLECLAEADVPPGLFNVVHGLGDVVGAEITRHPDVAKISFTGSTAVGQTIARDGAATMKRVTLELGGKSPTLLLEDVDLAAALPAALGMAYFNSGQGCVAGTRLLIPESRADEVERAIVAAMDTVTVGPPDAEDTTVGPMVSEKQYERVQSYIRTGLEEGAELLVGGVGRPDGLERGFFVRPTVFVGVRNDMRIAQEEIFGPVLSVISYRDEDDAVAIANDTPYGLAAYVHGADEAATRRVASRIRAGRVTIGAAPDEPGAPFGGFKLSGIGREFGTHGVESFTEPKTVLA